MQVLGTNAIIQIAQSDHTSKEHLQAIMPLAYTENSYTYHQQTHPQTEKKTNGKEAELLFQQEVNS